MTARVKPRQLTVATVGLPVRAEMRLKSLLELVNARTTDSWSFIEQASAHVVICDPTSALSTLAIKRSLHSPTRFVSLVSDESQSAAGTDFMRDPIRAGDLIDLLNHVSATIGAEPAQGERTATGVERDAFPVAMTVRRLAKNATGEIFQLQTEIMTLHVVPSERTVLLTQPLDQDSINRLAKSDVHIDIKPLPASHAHTLATAGAQSCKVDALLWRLGLHGTNNHVLPELPADGLFKLRRWPDFGRVEHAAEHRHLAARLVRQQISAQDLATSTNQPMSAVTAFINACGLCELLEVHLASTARRVPPAAAGMRTRGTGILKTIRSVLRLGGSP